MPLVIAWRTLIPLPLDSLPSHEFSSLSTILMFICRFSSVKSFCLFFPIPQVALPPLLVQVPFFLAPLRSELQKPELVHDLKSESQEIYLACIIPIPSKMSKVW